MTTDLPADGSHAESALPPHIARLPRPPALAKAQALAFLLFEKPDLARLHTFLRDFGMHTVQADDSQLQMRGLGGAPCIYWARKGPRSRYVGAAFVVEDTTDFDRLLKEPGAHELPAGQIPGGGWGVALTDPAGNQLWLITGQRRAAPLPVPADDDVPVNFPDHKRRVNATVRPLRRPAQINKLGHMVLRTAQFDAMADWYMRMLGVIPTDVQYLADGSPNLCFLRLDLGGKPADHHALVIVGGVDDGFEHGAFEVRDLDALGQGQQALLAGGHRHAWGIGRHVLGSQLFDYWFDPDGVELEHYADGDVFTSDYETHYSPLDLGGLYAWGHDMPPHMRQRPSLAMLAKALGQVRRKRLTFKKLKLLGRVLEVQPRPWL